MEPYKQKNSKDQGAKRKANPTNNNFTIALLGGPGVGKSTVGNFLIDGENSGKFVSSKSTDTGVTKKVTSHKNNVLRNKDLPIVQVFDTPGLTDPELPIENWAQQVRSGITSVQNIDMVLLVIKATDYRMDISQICACQAMKKFIEGLEPQNIFIILTHCDSSKAKVDEIFINDKIASFKKYANLEIPQENIVQFDNTKESLEEFVENFIKGSAHIIENIDQGLEKFDDGLNNMAQQIDQQEENSRLRQQLNVMYSLYNNIVNVNQQVTNVVQNKQTTNIENTNESTNDNSNDTVRKKYWRPLEHGGKKEDGSPDMRCKMNWPEEQKEEQPSDQQNESGYWRPSEHDGLTEAGKPDGRMKQPDVENIFNMPQQQTPQVENTLIQNSNINPESSGPTKADGTLDMRFSVNKEAVNNQNDQNQLSMNSGFQDSSTAGFANGADMSNQISSSQGGDFSNSGAAQNTAEYSGRTTLSGAPDLRTVEGKAWKAAQE